ncbi:MAG: FAD-dependent oxidoreductase [Ilumatobacteraceae bacterium]
MPSRRRPPAHAEKHRRVRPRSDGTLGDKARLARLQHRLRHADPRSLLRGRDVSTLDAFPDQLAAQLAPGSIALDTPIGTIGNCQVTTASGQLIDARRVIVATDGPAAVRLLGLPDMASRSASCVWFAATRPPIPDKLIVLDGTGEGPALNVAVVSNVAPEYAPDGAALIAAACPGIAADDLELAVRSQLGRWWGPQVDSWRHLKTNTIAHAQPDHRSPFHPKQSTSLGNGLFVCGDHRDTPSIQGALYSGRRCGTAAVASLT